MAQRIIIDPVSRIEGHAKITIHLGDDGNVSDAEFQTLVQELVGPAGGDVPRRSPLRYPAVTP